MKNLRPPAAAGTFYSSNPAQLQKNVDIFLKQAFLPEIDGEIKALISPHAGYMYSGQVAAHAYKTVEGKDSSAVIVVAPSHTTRFYGASIYQGSGYQIPTAVVPLHQELSQKILQHSDIINFVPAAHLQEHSLEVQLPFLQTVLPGFELVPVVMGSQDLETCRKVAQAIAQAVKGEKVLLVASSDLSHYHSYASAVQLDKTVQEYVKNFDPEGLAGATAKGTCEACGAGPIITVMLAAKQLGADTAHILNYANSGDVSGNKAQVVGYLAAALSSSAENKAMEKKNGKLKKIDMGLSAQDKKLLKHIAKTTIENAVQGKPIPEFKLNSPVLKEKRGAFVTITKHGRLRGCIGYIQAVKPLYRTVEEMARAAALNDNRFSPVKPDELPELDLEISVLTPLKAVSNIEEIKVGKHGLYIQQGFMNGLLLPQVATEYNWDCLTFLQHTCQKAGLPANTWKDKDTRIYLFSADIF